MPRTTRKKSAYGYYHVMIRGVNRQDIFRDDDDRLKLIRSMEYYSKEQAVDIIVYCLMSNHVHILVLAPNGLDMFIKKLSASYVYFFNHKHDRIGHLFQDRYKSEAIESDAYLMTASRYILQNPQKAGICQTQNYQWSSWKDVITLTGFTKPGILYDLAEEHYPLIEYLLSENDERCLDLDQPRIMSDSAALREAQRITGEVDLTKIRNYPAQQRKALILQMKEAGLSIRQIAQFTEIDRNMIQRTKEK